MPRSISAPDAQAAFNDLLADVQDGMPTEIVQNGQRVAVMISAKAFDRYWDQEAAADWAIIDEMRRRNAHLDPDEVLAEVTEVVEEVRQERYEAEQRLAAESSRRFEHLRERVDH